MANCMVNPYTGKAILANGRTAKKIRADRFGRMARGLMGVLLPLLLKRNEEDPKVLKINLKNEKID